MKIVSVILLKEQIEFIFNTLIIIGDENFRTSIMEIKNLIFNAIDLISYDSGEVEHAQNNNHS